MGRKRTFSTCSASVSRWHLLEVAKDGCAHSSVHEVTWIICGRWSTATKGKGSVSRNV
jgi:hypothetical protein